MPTDSDRSIRDDDQLVEAALASAERQLAAVRLAYDRADADGMVAAVRRVRLALGGLVTAIARAR